MDQFRRLTLREVQIMLDRISIRQHNEIVIEAGIHGKKMMPRKIDYRTDEEIKAFESKVDELTHNAIARKTWPTH